MGSAQREVQGATRAVINAIGRVGLSQIYVKKSSEISRQKRVKMQNRKVESGYLAPFTGFAK